MNFTSSSVGSREPHVERSVLTRSDPIILLELLTPGWLPCICPSPAIPHLSYPAWPLLCMCGRDGAGVCPAGHRTLVRPRDRLSAAAVSGCQQSLDPTPTRWSLQPARVSRARHCDATVGGSHAGRPPEVGSGVRAVGSPISGPA